MVDVHCKGHWRGLAILSIVVAGCDGQTGVTVSGKVIDGGRPVAIERYEEGASCVQVEFCPLDESGNPSMDAPTQNAICRQDGSFVVMGYDGKGIRAGKYRVAVRRLGETPNGPGDVWQGKFDREKSPFVFEVPGSQEIVIDISQAPGG